MQCARGQRVTQWFAIKNTSTTIALNQHFCYAGLSTTLAENNINNEAA